MLWEQIKQVRASLVISSICVMVEGNAFGTKNKVSAHSCSVYFDAGHMPGKAVASPLSMKAGSGVYSWGCCKANTSLVFSFCFETAKE